MAIEQLKFTKDWTNPADFPTVETDEVQVRQDLQQLHSEVRDYLNGTLLPAIEEGYVPGERAVNGHPLTADVTLTRADVGLGQVDNTADMDKPVSTAQAAAIREAVMGQLPEGSVKLATLEESVAAAVTRAEEGGALDDKMEALAAEQADLFHAGQHASGGSDPITPAAIGAVKKSGDTMTGHLTISVPNYTQIMLDNTGAGSRVKIQNGGHYAYIGMQDASAESNQRQIIIRDKTNKDSSKEALQLVDVVNGTNTYYNILHTGNFEEYAAPRTVQVDYTGTGTKTVSVAVGITPKVVVVQQINSSERPYAMPLVMTSVGKICSLRVNETDPSTGNVEVTAFGPTVSWQTDSIGSMALNTSGKSYRLIALC